MRRKPFSIKMLQYYGLVTRYIIKNTDLKRADLELLMYLNGLDYFTQVQFKMGGLLYSWDRRRFRRLQDSGWINRLDTRHTDGGYKYTISQKARLTLTRIEKLLAGEETLPEKPRSKSHSDLLYSVMIKKFNRKND